MACRYFNRHSGPWQSGFPLFSILADISGGNDPSTGGQATILDVWRSMRRNWPMLLLTELLTPKNTVSGAMQSFPVLTCLQMKNFKAWGDTDTPP